MESLLPARLRLRWATVALALLAVTVLGLLLLFVYAPLAFASAAAFAAPLVLAAGVFAVRWTYRAVTGHRTVRERGAPGTQLGRPTWERRPPAG